MARISLRSRAWHGDEDIELTTPDGDLLWSARASTSRPPEDPHDLAALLVPALADHLGETVYGKKVQ